MRFTAEDSTGITLPWGEDQQPNDSPRGLGDRAEPRSWELIERRPCRQPAAVGNGSGANVVEVRGDEYAYVMPEHIEGGVVTLEFSNTGKELHEYSLDRKSVV